MLYYNKQSISKDDIKSVSEALKEDIITRGNLVDKFEKEICKITKSKFSTSFNSASSALTASCFALDINKNDLVWTVPNTFVSTASSALHFSARIDFVDIDKKDKNICLEQLEQKLIFSNKKNQLPKLLITVHFAGQPTKQEKIFKLAKKYRFKILEDASHSFGAFRKKEPVGSCKWSDITVSSFHPVKTITTGEGGVACCKSKNIDRKLKIFKNNGIEKDKKYFKNKIGLFYYEQQYLGHNFHMSDINAALGLSQLKKIKKFINRRKKISNYYDKNLYKKNLILPWIDKLNMSSYHLYNCNFKNTSDRKKVYLQLKKNKIILNTHYIPVHLHPIYLKMGFKKGNFPNSEWHYDTSLSLPIYFDLKNKDLDKTISIINKILK